MTRLETTVAVLAAATLFALHGPAAAQSVVVGGGEAQAKVAIQVGKKDKTAKPAKPPAPPEVPTFKVTGDLVSSRDGARDSAIRAAVEKVHEHLLQQEPPVDKMPPTDLVRRMILDGQDEVIEEEVDLPTGKVTMYQVKVGVKVRPEHVRELRSRDRAANGLWILAGLGGLAGVFALFFKVDAWTKGYLTSWLVLGTVGAASLVGGLWWMAK